MKILGIDQQQLQHADLRDYSQLEDAYRDVVFGHGIATGRTNWSMTSPIPKAPGKVVISRELRAAFLFGCLSAYGDWYRSMPLDRSAQRDRFLTIGEWMAEEVYVVQLQDPSDADSALRKVTYGQWLRQHATLDLLLAFTHTSLDDEGCLDVDQISPRGRENAALVVQSLQRIVGTLPTSQARQILSAVANQTNDLVTHDDRRSRVIAFAHQYLSPWYFSDVPARNGKVFLADLQLGLKRVDSAGLIALAFFGVSPAVDLPVSIWRVAAGLIEREVDARAQRAAAMRIDVPTDVDDEMQQVVVEQPYRSRLLAELPKIYQIRGGPGTSVTARSW